MTRHRNSSERPLGVCVTLVLVTVLTWIVRPSDLQGRVSAEPLSSEQWPIGTVTRYAGTGADGFSGDGGPAESASFSSPLGLTYGPDSALYVVDYGNNRIRRVGSDGRVTTVAGNGVWGYSGDGGRATAAALKSPSGIAFGPDGSMYIADANNMRIRRVSPTGQISTVAGNGGQGFAGDGGPAVAAQLNFPHAVAVTSEGVLYFSDFFNYRIRRITPDGTVMTVAGSGRRGADGDGGPATEASLGQVYSIAVAPDGRVFLADRDSNAVRVIGMDGVITAAVRIDSPNAVAVATDGTLLIAGRSHIYRVAPGGTPEVIAGRPSYSASGDRGAATCASVAATSIAISQEGDLFFTDASSHGVRRLWGHASELPVAPAYTDLPCVKREREVRSAIVANAQTTDEVVGSQGGRTFTVQVLKTEASRQQAYLVTESKSELIELVVQAANLKGYAAARVLVLSPEEGDDLAANFPASAIAYSPTGTNHRSAGRFGTERFGDTLVMYYVPPSALDYGDSDFIDLGINGLLTGQFSRMVVSGGSLYSSLSPAEVDLLDRFKLLYDRGILRLTPI
jgi:streptogramin lyase